MNNDKSLEETQGWFEFMSVKNFDSTPSRVLFQRLDENTRRLRRCSKVEGEDSVQDHKMANQVKQTIFQPFPTTWKIDSDKVISKFLSIIFFLFL